MHGKGKTVHWETYDVLGWVQELENRRRTGAS
ncbi:hypothetical protein ES703_23679 [subsurface metagenome]